jgi:hypothetical protein
MPMPIKLALATGAVVLGALTVMIGAGLVVDMVGGLASAFGNAMARISSQAPATVAPSGVAVDTPLLDTPDNGGYTSQTPLPLSGSIPGTAAGKTDSSIILYRIAANGARQQVTQVAIGATTRFNTSPISLVEGANTFVATLKTTSGEGQPSPQVTWILDTTPPSVIVTSPVQNAQIAAGVSSLTVSGKTEAGARVIIRNEQAPGGAASSTTAGSDGKFSLSVPTVAGSNTIDLTATDKAGNSGNASVVVKRDYGKLAAHLTASPAKFAASSKTTVTLTVHATTVSGSPLAGAKVTFTVTVQGVAPIVSPELTTDSTGVATWQVAISGATAGTGQASVLMTSPAGDQVTETADIVTT